METTTPPESPETPRGPAQSGRKKFGRGMLWGLLAIVIAFFVGFFWQFYEATTVREDLAVAEQALEVERLRVQLAQAALAAQSADYESARQRMSGFFTALQEQEEILPPELASLSDDFLAQRDQIITGLSRSNHEFAAVLYGMLGRFEEAAPSAAIPVGGTAGEELPGGEEGAAGGGPTGAGGTGPANGAAGIDGNQP